MSFRTPSTSSDEQDQHTEEVSDSTESLETSEGGGVMNTSLIESHVRHVHGQTGRGRRTEEWEFATDVTARLDTLFVATLVPEELQAGKIERMQSMKHRDATLLTLPAVEAACAFMSRKHRSTTETRGD